MATRLTRLACILPLMAAVHAAGEAPTRSDLAYGPDARNVLDFWKAPAAGLTPVLIYFHGGGFVQGDKAEFRDHRLLRACLASGISVVAANYRFVTTAPFPAPLLDGARVLAFVRERARESGLDASRIALSGGSAGGTLALAVGFHGKGAAGVRCLVCFDPPTSVNPTVMRRFIYDGQTLPAFTWKIFGLPDATGLGSDRVLALAEQSSPLALASPQAPPVYLEYAGSLTPTPLHEGTPQGVFLHHPRWGELLTARLAELGVPCQFAHGGNPPPPGAALAFLKKQFGMEP
ncbi:MAG: alpha/beta hydrolase [Spirochaetes bacterium]|nr:alpha/beta hydrolase [Spirochaetota bacterium]